MTRQLLVAMDDSPPARAALEHALETFPEADITVLNVVDSLEAAYAGRPVDEAPPEPEFFENLAADTSDHAGNVSALVIEGEPAETVVSYAEENGFDGIIIGSKGRSGVSRMLLGSVAEAVAREATMPVTIVS
ncbi:universal stress protein [Halobacteria archaeon AArc-curdl1]|uniref:Universal stress protein n=1 Tax=Natronosalvus hydrolyticus TaxID=2979988 RepID=A0AAP2Z7F8_9EURY|nr:universal stress protein [Halobacteria archaeon AArc-curdl1]